MSTSYAQAPAALRLVSQAVSFGFFAFASRPARISEKASPAQADQSHLHVAPGVPAVM